MPSLMIKEVTILLNNLLKELSLFVALQIKSALNEPKY